LPVPGFPVKRLDEMSGNEFERPGRWWRPLEGGFIECELCPRQCRLREGQRGFCFVRMCEGGKIVLTTYGRSSGFCVDPIEKKPLNHFYPGSSILSFGTAGCNLGCRFCQNWDISRAHHMDRLADQASPRAIAQAARRQGCRSVAFTYNEPTIFAEYALDTAQACHEEGIQTVAVTAGYISDAARPEFYAGMDAANVDLKSFSEKFYKEQCLGSLAPVLETLKYLKHETQIWFEITTLLVPGLNDSDAELNAMTEWIAENLGPDVPLHLTAFHPDYKLTDVPPTSIESLQRARQIALSKGLHFVYTGNVRDPRGSSTWCPSCGKLLIERDGYRLGAFAIRNGACSYCHAPIAGRFEDEPGDWGPRRAAVRIGLD
jgi:pyruvate formate lyase activating enzyme